MARHVCVRTQATSDPISKSSRDQGETGGGRIIGVTRIITFKHAYRNYYPKIKNTRKNTKQKIDKMRQKTPPTTTQVEDVPVRIEPTTYSRETAQGDSTGKPYSVNTHVTTRNDPTREPSLCQLPTEIKLPTEIPDTDDCHRRLPAKNPVTRAVYVYLQLSLACDLKVTSQKRKHQGMQRENHPNP